MQESALRTYPMWQTRFRFAYVWLAAGLVGASAGLPGRGVSAQESKLETVATLPSPGSTENLCQTSDGSIYITGLEDKVIWKVNPDRRVEKFASLPSLAAVVGIAAANTGVVITTFGKPFRRPAPAAADGRATPPAQVTDFSDVAPAVLVLDQKGQVTATIPGEKGSAFNGITLARAGVYLIADSFGSAVWRFDLATKRLESWLKDDALSPTGTAGIGANGIKVRDGWVYVTVSNRNAIYRVQIGADGRPKGALVKFAEGFRPDDFDVTRNGTLYAPSGTSMYKVSPKGEVSTFLENVPGAAATLISPDGKWLYWPTRGGTMPQRLVRTAIQ